MDPRSTRTGQSLAGRGSLLGFLVCLGLGVGCMSIAGLDKDYVLGSGGNGTGNSGNVGNGGTGNTGNTGNNGGNGGTGNVGNGGTGNTGNTGGNGGTGNTGNTGGSGGTGANGGSGGGPPPVLTCDGQYPVVAPIQQITEETPTTCNLCVSTMNVSCQAICAAGGGECLGSHNDNPNNSCIIDLAAPFPCTHIGFTSEICTCSLGCSGWPCLAPATCTGGVCS